MKKRCKKLYRKRDFETLTALFGEYSRKVEEYKARIMSDTNNAEQFKIEFDGKSTFDGTLLQRIGWTLLCRLLTTITLGIMYPTALCLLMRWRAKHTLYNGKRLSFDGRGLQLFGKWICWLLLTLITLGIYAFFVSKKLWAWKAKHTHIAGEFKALGGTFDGKILALFGYNILCGFISLITLGLAIPAAICIKKRWIAKHTVYDGRRLSFDGKGIQLFGKYIIWWLLSVITLGIYSLWIPNRILKWMAVHTELTEGAEVVF